jgi:hypothetical protein
LKHYHNRRRKRKRERVSFLLNKALAEKQQMDTITSTRRLLAA